ncbi:MAG TPA: GNAT family N-acetyltransferase [bacterium]
MKATIVPAEALPEGVWSRFVKDHPQGNVFHSPELHQVFMHVTNHRPISLAAIPDGECEPVALLSAVLVDVMGGPFRRFTSRGILYGGLLGSVSGEQSDTVKALVQAYDNTVRSMAILTEIRNASEPEPYRSALESQGYRCRAYLNYIIDLTLGPDRMAETFSSSCRRNIRKAQASGLEVLEASTIDDLSVFYGLIRKTYARVKVAHAKFSLFEQAFGRLQSQNQVRFFLAYLGDRAVACRVAFFYKDCVTDWYAGADPEFLKACPNEYLVWHILQLASRMGYRTFDFGGAGYPDEPYGVRDFKARFGGHLVDYGRYTRIYSPLRFGMARWGYKAYRLFIGS